MIGSYFTLLLGGGGWKLLGNKRTRSKPLGGTWAASPDVSVLRSAGGVDPSKSFLGPCRFSNLSQQEKIFALLVFRLGSIQYSDGSCSSKNYVVLPGWSVHFTVGTAWAFHFVFFFAFLSFGQGHTLPSSSLSSSEVQRDEVFVVDMHTFPLPLVVSLPILEESIPGGEPKSTSFQKSKSTVHRDTGAPKYRNNSP